MIGTSTKEIAIGGDATANLSTHGNQIVSAKAETMVTQTFRGTNQFNFAQN
jgi:hypothetical protein